MKSGYVLYVCRNRCVVHIKSGSDGVIHVTGLHDTAALIRACTATAQFYQEYLSGSVSGADILLIHLQSMPVCCIIQNTLRRMQKLWKR